MNRALTDKLIEQNSMIVIAGPTASGKTAASLLLAELLDSEIISADSRQLFKYLNIGTAKPSKEELTSVKHHFIDILYPDETYSAGIFGSQSEIAAESILKQGKVPLVVGGSGLYILSLCEGLFTESEKLEIPEIRNKLNLEFQDKGIEYLYKILSEHDAVSAEKYADKNPRRILRALEFFYINGFPISEAHIKQKIEKNFNTIYFFIDIPREELYNRINMRTNQMWEQGLPEETKHVLKLGYSEKLNSLNTVGYKECIRYLNGKIPEQVAIDEIRKNTRHYAKRQVTWFGSKPQYIHIHHSTPELVSKFIYDYLSNI